MTTLSINKPRALVLGTSDDVPIIAADIVYEGTAVGDNGAGYGRPLVAGDLFRGFALEKFDNAAGAAGAQYIRVARAGRIQLPVTGLVITDVDQPVYATDDDTFTLLPVGGSFIGYVSRWVENGLGVVAFDTAWADPWQGPRETLADNKTLDAEDTGKTFFVTVDAKVVSLPATATAGAGITLVNAGGAGTVAVNVSPVAADKIMGPDLAGTDNKDLINTKATAKRGDYVRLMAGHADGWVVTAMRGTWVTEA